MTPTIRPALSTDADALAGLTTQLGYPTGNTLMTKRLPAILDHKDHVVFVALVQEEVIGWIHGCEVLRVESDPFIEIGGLVVHQDYRRHNIGRLLVEAIIEWSVIRNHDKLRVRCNTLRTETHQFYQHLGFTLNKEQKVFDITLPFSIASLPQNANDAGQS